MSLVILKLLGFVFMIIDHLGILFDLFPLRLIGRLSFPIFAFCVANGVIHTSNRKKYLLRLLLLAIVSEIPFDLFMFGKLSFETQNVFFTFVLGFICISLFDLAWSKSNSEKQFCFTMIAILLTSFLGNFINVDYGFCGVYVIFWFYFSLKTKRRYMLLIPFLLLSTFSGFGIIGALSLIFIKAYDADKPFSKKINKCLYIVYPVHLIILFVLRCLL